MATNLQALGVENIPVYANAAALALDLAYRPVGALAALQSPPQLLMAIQQVPSSYVAVITAGNGVTYYWVPVESPDDISGQSSPFTARAVVTSLAAYGGSGTGTLTGTATGAIGAQDGVTLAAGDQVLIQAGTTHVSAVDSGPWTVVNPGGTGVSYILKRPYWWATGNKWSSGKAIFVGGEGTIFNGSEWKATAAAGVIDTTDPAIFCKKLVFQRTLASGTLALSAGQPTGNNFPCGIIGTASSAATQAGLLVGSVTAGGSQTGTVSYGSKALTAGYVGTATASIFAFATAQATQTNDDSVVTCVFEQ
jgi:hypothetical protein